MFKLMENLGCTSHFKCVMLRGMQQEEKQDRKERHYGIDLLRIVAMLMVCILHCNLHRGYNLIDPHAEPVSWLTWHLSEALCIIAVNLYAMITGYVCILSPWRISRYLALWLQGTFYIIGFYALVPIAGALGYAPGQNSISIMTNILWNLLFGPYWYFNAYTILFFVMPFLNKLLLQLEPRTYIQLMLVLFLLFPCLNIFSIGVYNDGYDAVWLAALYVGGAFFRLHSVHLPRYSCFAAYLFSAIAVCALCLAHFRGYFVLSYAFPLNVIGALALFSAFTTLRLSNRFIRAIIRWIAPLTFGIYLIQCHPLVWRMLSKAGHYLSTQYGHSPWAPLTGGIFLFVVCMGIEWLRTLLFRHCHAQILVERLASYATRIWHGCWHRIQPLFLPPQK